MEDFLIEARKLTYGEIERTEIPSKYQADVTVEAGRRLAKKLGVNADIVEAGTLLMDCMLGQAIKENGLEGKVRLALDVASSSFYEDGLYKVDNKEITKEELANIYDSLTKEFDLLSIEDPFDEIDFESFAKLKEEQDGLIVVGDDLTVTNKILLQEAIDKESVNGMIIKPNQIGTLSETLETMRLARENDIELIVSHRSGETDDDFIADLAFAFGCFGLKAGSPLKPERMVKYQRLIEISKM